MGERSLWMAQSLSLWEQALMSIQLGFMEVDRRMGVGKVRYVLTGGTLLALLRHGTAARDIEGVEDFVDKDIDVMVLADSATEWWETIVVLDEILRSHGWQGCSVTVRDARTMQSELEVQELQLQTGYRLFDRGVMELSCGMFGIDSLTYEPAVVPFNAVWVQPFRFSQLLHGRRLYHRASSKNAQYLLSSSACHGDSCFALQHFPLQSWRGALPLQALFPAKTCIFLPSSKLAKKMLMPNEEKPLIITLPCPREPVRLLRWYDRGELWGRIDSRPCLALPVVVEHDRVNTSGTGRLKDSTLSYSGVNTIYERMVVLDSLGGLSLSEEATNCTLSAEGYEVFLSVFKGSSTREADCGPMLLAGMPDWRSPTYCPWRIRHYNRLLGNSSQEWSLDGYLKMRRWRKRPRT